MENGVMNFDEKRKKQLGIKSLGDLKRSGIVSGEIDRSKFVNGPKKIDCLVRPWHRGDMTGILAGTGIGKCLAKDTPVLLFNGDIKPVQDVQEGDLLMGPDSTPRKVLSLARGRQEMFRVTGTDGSSYVVNRSHILSLKYNNSESRFGFKKGDILNISIDDYLKKSNKFKSVFKGYRVGVEFEERFTLLDPYLMGLWLGDGTKTKPQITNNDKEVIQYIHNYLNTRLGYKVSNVSRNFEHRCPQWDITMPGGKNLFLTETKKFVNVKNEKYINRDYLLNSRTNRLKLLAGILDTDGSLSNNCYDICIKDDSFANDFEFLCRSLGLKVHRSVKTAAIKSIDFTGQYHRFTISGNLESIPCLISRKQAKERKQIKDPLSYGITLESLGEGDYYGFTIDGDHLFLLGDFVVTHNTSYSLYILKHILLNNPDGVVAFVSLEMTASEIAEKWDKMTENSPGLSDRFYIVENYDENGHSKNLNVNLIKHELKKIKEGLNETLIAYVLDHLHEISIEGAVKDYNPICRELKNMTVELDSHGFILSQTTKGKGIGDIPVPKDGCYGTSRYENLMTNIITIFQPLLRVQREVDMPILGWQYAKIRYKNKGDKVRENMNYLLMFDYDTEDLKELNKQEKADFAMYYEKVLELRQNEEKFKSYQFDLSDIVKAPDGREIKIHKIIGGNNPKDDL